MMHKIIMQKLTLCLAVLPLAFYWLAIILNAFFLTEEKLAVDPCSNYIFIERQLNFGLL